MSKPDNPFAFPSKELTTYDDPGMTLRDWFAGRAMQAFYSSFDARKASIHADDLASDAELFYRMADAMLAERAKVKP